MHKLRDLVFGPGRAVSVLSLTEILAWGILIYPPVLIMPHLTADHGWSLAFGMAGFLNRAGDRRNAVADRRPSDRSARRQYRDVAGRAGGRARPRAADTCGAASGL